MKATSVRAKLYCSLTSSPTEGLFECCVIPVSNHVGLILGEDWCDTTVYCWQIHRIMVAFFSDVVKWNVLGL